MVTATNTYLLVPEFELLEPPTIEDAVVALAEHGDSARVLAGGTDLLVQMKTGRLEPAFLVSLHRIAELQRIDEPDGLTVGSTVTLQALWSHATVRERYQALAEACHAFSTVQTMTMGTIGGNLCNASPAADAAPALLVLDAIVHARSVTGSRAIPLDEFFTGPGESVLGADELLESIELPPPSSNSGSAFVKLGRVAADIAKVCVAARVVRDGDLVRECRIALGAVAPTPLRARGAEASLTGERFTAAALAQAIAAARDEIEPITDTRSTADYRRQVAGAIVGDVLRAAWERAGGEEIA